MFRPLAGVVFSVAVASAADPGPRFVWTAGDTLTYKVVQTTTVDELTLDEKAKKPVAVKTITTVTSTKKWAVKDVDKVGAGTLEMSIVAFKQELTQTVGDGKPVLRKMDSADADDAKGMEFLGKVILTATVDAAGKVAAAKSEHKGATDRLQAELPFRLTWPDTMPAVGGSWERAFAFKPPPPLGTGETFDVTQTYTLRGTKEGYYVVGMASKLKDELSDPALGPAVAPVLWSGDVFLNAKSGKYHGAKLTAALEVANHRGDGTKFVYRSEYTEAAENK